MKRMRCLSFLILSISQFLIFQAQAQTGTWKAYISYYEPQQIVKAGSHTLFVRASNGLYSYNLNDHSITTYDKIQQLSDNYITLIAWNQKVQQLIIVYGNSNIDLMDSNGNVTNISALYTKSMTQDKTVNSIFFSGSYAYLATGFGVVKVNMERAEISESYILDINVSNIDSYDGKLYVKDFNGTVYAAPLTANLIDKHNWSVVTDLPTTLFANDDTDWNEYQSLVSSLHPDGPKYNNFAFMRHKNGTLYTVGGGYKIGSSERNVPGAPQVYNAETGWTIYDDDVKGKFEVEQNPDKIPLWNFVDMLTIDVDPLDSRHVFAAGRPGLFEYYDGELKAYYNKDNSILQSATTSNRYVLVEGIAFDKEGNLWMVQSLTSGNSILELTKEGEWRSHPQSLLMNGTKTLSQLQQLTIDSRGLLWMVNNHYEISSFYCYDSKADKINTYMTRLVNQDGSTATEMYYPHCLAEDLEGNIWIGTAEGPYLIEADRVNLPIDYATQVKVPRNDGTDYADYLLAGIDITAIAVDGGNRKWFGTRGSGVYLISNDNMEQIQHFITDNSPLLSNNIESIAINNSTGEVFFGTDQGLCSYMSDATEASIEMVKDNVYAFPNPVTSGYDGLITVVGLSMNADVKILSASGQLVAQGRSNGGTFTWDGRDRSGRRVASGIYMVAAATSEGKKGTVCKIAIIN
ncbi:MAG: Por secretion system protein [Prevotella sp.]|nr:Por secretion system protein [Prevotella sp.]